LKLLPCYILQIYLFGICAVDTRRWVGRRTDRYRVKNKNPKLLKKTKKSTIES